MPLAPYLAFVARQRRFAAFGFAMAFASSFGQTYFIGVFGPSLQAELGLSHTLWGAVYMSGTLVSALLLPWSGRWIDAIALRSYALAAGLLLAFACAVVSQASGVASLIVAVFLLRQAGQGLMSHIALTAMARYFEGERGRAIAVATLGFSAGEAVLPVIAVAAIGALGWRATYGGLALVLAVVLIPGVVWLTRGHDARHRDYLGRVAAGTSDDGVRAWTRAEVLRDARFYLMVPGLLAPGLIFTAMFFHHLNIAEAKGWSHAWVTGNYVVYAAATVAASLASGALIDRLGAVRLVPYMLLPPVAALLVLAAFDSRWALWPYLVLAGTGIGVVFTATSALWAELYGVAHLGAVKSLFAALAVFASALGPIVMGAAVDLGLTFDQVCIGFAGYAAGGAFLLRRALRGARDSAG